MGQPGYVYILRMGEPFENAEVVYKIGRSSHPHVREYQIGIKLPFPTTVILVMRTDDMGQTESELHRRYSSVRLAGEWFRLTDEHITELVHEIREQQEGCVCRDYNPSCPYMRICHPDMF